jgi:hypothetical protein
MAGPGTNSILGMVLEPCSEYLGKDCGSEEVAARLYIFLIFADQSMQIGPEVVVRRSRRRISDHDHLILSVITTARVQSL